MHQHSGDIYSSNTLTLTVITQTREQGHKTILFNSVSPPVFLENHISCKAEGNNMKTQDYDLEKSLKGQAKAFDHNAEIN